jgi:hypothetical protein
MLVIFPVPARDGEIDNLFYSVEMQIFEVAKLQGILAKLEPRKCLNQFCGKCFANFLKLRLQKMFVKHKA